MARGASHPGESQGPVRWSGATRGRVVAQPGHPSSEGFYRPCCCLPLGHGCGCGSLRAATSCRSLLRPAWSCPLLLAVDRRSIVLALLIRIYRSLRVYINCTLITCGWTASTLGHSVHFFLPDALYPWHTRRPGLPNSYGL